MWIFRHEVPVLGILGFGDAAFDLCRQGRREENGLNAEHIKMFDVLAVIQTLRWILVIVGLRMGAARAVSRVCGWGGTA
ncbi:hypothetical protein HZA56_19600 [Candidatus Poribacteria bacterium]|nr:hypothetical protein [Candidatus Poribacteria bacterium]